MSHCAATASIFPALRSVTCAVTYLIAAATSPAVAEDAGEAQSNNGQDITRPVTRLDTRLKYIDAVAGAHSNVITLRMDKPFPLQNRWQISTRLDLPFMGNELDSEDNPLRGVSDVLLQVLAITPPQGPWTAAFGAQLIAPTASQDRLGADRWQLGPMVALIHALPGISAGSFAGGVIRFTTAIDDGDRPFTDKLSLQPLLNVNLPDKWFVSLTPEIQFNADDDWEMFLPFNVTVGTMIRPGVVASLQADVALVDDFPQYDWQVEARVGFFF